MNQHDYGHGDARFGDDCYRPIALEFIGRHVTAWRAVVASEGYRMVRGVDYFGMPGGPQSRVPGPEAEAQLVVLHSLEDLAIRQASEAPELMGERVRLGRDPTGRPGRRIPWQLVGVLVIQAALTLRLIWSNTAFEDEALYLWSGHLEWARWVHGMPVPAFQTWFSGAPVLYPALGAIADSAGGLAAARLLSMLAMTGVTCCLWGTARRLVGGRAALVAVAMFATLAGTAFLGAFATYDALALLLLTAATLVAVQAGVGPAGEQGERGLVLGRAGQQGERGRHGPGLARTAAACLLAGVLLGVACAVKYATALFCPVVVVIAVLAARRQVRVAALAAIAGGWLLTVAAGLAAGGSPYWHGILVTTLNRAPATSSPWTVLKLSYIWTAFIVFLALLAIVVSGRETRRNRWLLRVLAMAILLVPAEQARIGTTVSLHKHVVFGAWFASMAAAYVLARLSLVDRTRGWVAVLSIPILAAALLSGVPQASALFGKWPDSAPIDAALPALLTRYPGRCLTSEDLYQVLGYYDRDQAGWDQWSGTLNFRLSGQPPGLASDQAGIARSYFSLVVIATQRWQLSPVDKSVMAALEAPASGYRLVASVGGFLAWAPQGKA
jgi:4-amino-4-deoxy-L-arabinose transferase-like glycosyltransferase